MIFPETRLKRLGVDFPFMVAPMVGLSHVAFRELIRAYTPEDITPLIFTEMLSSRRLPSERLEKAENLYVAENERGLVPQILGNEERFIAPSLEKLMELRPWGIDINMGCPKKKTLSHNWGVLLLGDRNYAAEVVRITKKHSSRPVSVKLRAGLGESIDLDYLDGFTEALEGAGADWLTIHCRSSQQKHRGRADWEVVSKLSKKRTIPLVANGDVQTANDAVQLIRDYGVDGAMVARAATARPWILWQIAKAFGHPTTARARALDQPPTTPEEEGKEYFQAVLRFAFLLEKYFGPSKASLQRLKFYIGVSSPWLPFGHHFWKLIHACSEFNQAVERIEHYVHENAQPLRERVSH
ncbi:tRNA-dihydrouridine synthase family protein [bacterium]|nr:tRNA-dihydrouridine synthase family protein [bacterium]